MKIFFIFFLYLIVGGQSDEDDKNLLTIVKCLGKGYIEKAKKFAKQQCEECSSIFSQCNPVLACQQFANVKDQIIYGFEKLQSGQNLNFQFTQEIEGKLESNKDGPIQVQSLGMADATVKGNVLLKTSEQKLEITIGGDGKISASLKFAATTPTFTAVWNKCVKKSFGSEIELHPISLVFNVGPVPVLIDVYVKAELTANVFINDCMIQAELDALLPFIIKEQKITISLEGAPILDPNPLEMDTSKLLPSQLPFQIKEGQMDKMIQGRLKAQVNAKADFEIKAGLRVEINKIFSFYLRASANGKCDLEVSAHAQQGYFHAVVSNLNPVADNELNKVYNFGATCTLEGHYEYGVIAPKAIPKPTAMFNAWCKSKVDEFTEVTQSGITRNIEDGVAKKCIQDFVESHTGQFAEEIKGKLCDAISKKMAENPVLRNFEAALQKYKAWADSLNTGTKHELFPTKEWKMKRSNNRFRETDSHEIGGHHNNLLRGGGNPLQP